MLERDVLEQMQDSVAIFDRDSRMLYCNPASEPLLGLRLDEAAGKPLAEVFPGGNAPAMQAAVTQALGGDRSRFEQQLEGQPRWVSLDVFAVAEGACVLARETTYRHRLEAALERQQVLVEAGELLSGALDVQNTLEDVARLLVRRFALTAEIDLLDERGTAVTTRVVAHHDPALEALAREMYRRYPPGPEHPASAVVKTGEPRVLELSPEALARLAHDAEHAAMFDALGIKTMVGVPLVSRGRTLGALLCGASERPSDREDVTILSELGRRVGGVLDNARLFAAAQDQRRHAEEASRAKDEFLAVVSHELRSPLNAILGWSTMLRSGSLDDARRARALDTIERNARAQAHLVEELLDISRIITGKVRIRVVPIDLVGVVSAALDAIRPAAEAKGVRLQPVLDGKVDGLLGDPDRLQQVVWNLVSNAVRHTPSGGRVMVRVQATESHVEIVVQDTGEGIPPEFLPMVFERFVQAEGGTTRRHGGLGLGLAITKHLVELHGGKIAAQSEGAGKGASFVVRLPIAPVRSSPLPPAPPLAAGPEPLAELQCPPNLEGLRVLVVDDEEDARELLRSVLAHCKIDVLVAASADLALEALRAERPDVLVSDIGMPGGDGYELIKRVRALPDNEGGQTPAVALTAYGRMEDRTRALLAGFTMHVAKPIEPSELLVVVATVARRLR